MTKEDVLRLLAGGGHVSGQKMSEALGLSRAAVWKAIQQLRAEGYLIESTTNRGYRLAGWPDVLDRQILCHLLGDHPWADRVVVLDTVDSTNTYAKDLAARGAAHGTVVLTDQQTGGRGRRGRSFASPRGQGVYLSVVLRYDVPPDRLLHLTCVAAEAARLAVRDACGLETEIKWTNDLVVGKKKLCGILTELSVVAESGLTDYVVCGIGINCAQTPEDFPPEVAEMATSLVQCGRPTARAQVAAALIRRLHQAAADLLTASKPWLDGYRAHCMTLGKDVQLLRGDTVRFAHVDDMDDQGGLLVTLDDGTKETVFSGEVSVRGMYGYV